ncbi:MAG: DUF6547 family protein [Spirosomataceae bacterium]
MKELDTFGQFIIKNLYDNPISFYSMLENGQWKDKDSQKLYEKIKLLPTDSKKLIHQIIIQMLTNSLHDFLSALQEAHDFQKGIEIMVNDSNIADKTDDMQAGMLQGEIFDWIERFSEFT